MLEVYKLQYLSHVKDLVNNKKLTEEKIKEIIASEDGYNVEKITEVYSLNYFFGKK